VIGDVEPVGMCGSGLVDAVAELVGAGLLEASGRFVLVAAGNRRSLLLNARTLRLVRTFDVAGVPATSPASDQAAFGQTDGTVILLDLDSGRTTTLSGRATGSINAVSFSHDGGRLASADEDGTISVWNVRTRALREPLTGHPPRRRRSCAAPADELCTRPATTAA
jgi:WD40 repeat protein